MSSRFCRLSSDKGSSYQELFKERHQPSTFSRHSTSTKISTNARIFAPDENFARPILFSHFHKSGAFLCVDMRDSSVDYAYAARCFQIAGGSSVCLTMKRFSNMSMTNAKGDKLHTRNCNAPFSGPKFNVEEVKAVQTCESLTPLTTNEQGRPFHRLNFLAVEVPYKDKMPVSRISFLCGHETSVARVISHLSYHELNQSQLITWIKNRTPTPANSFIEGYPVVNNMVIRQLLGRKRYRNVRPIDQRDLNQAKTRVDLFHAFVPLEYLRHENVSRLLKSTIPEYYQALQVMNVTAKHQRKRAQPSDEVVRLVTEQNKYDILLHQYMLEKLGMSS